MNQWFLFGGSLIVFAASGSDLLLVIDRVRFAYPAKSLNYLPITLGRDKGIFQAEGVELQIILDITRRGSGVFVTLRLIWVGTLSLWTTTSIRPT